MNEYRKECEFVGSEICEEIMDEKGLNLSEEERKHFNEMGEEYE